MARRLATTTTAARADRRVAVRHNTTLKLAIVKHGIPQVRLADRMGMSQFRLSRIVRGRIEPTNDEQDRLAEILGVSRRSLFAAP